MKKTLSLLLLALMVSSAFADHRTGEQLIADMHARYAGKWYKNVTFSQKTVTYKPDGTTETAIWYEVISLPGRLRIDHAPIEKGDGVLFVDGKIHVFRDGKGAAPRPFVHPLLVLGFDVYGQPPETTIEQLKSLKLDFSVVHEEKWQGRDTYVVGAKQGDLTTIQFWVDKKNLYFVRLIQPGGTAGRTIRETQFNKYEKLKGGWISPEVLFFTDGKMTLREDYADIQADVALDADLWDPAKWMTVEKSYFRKKQE